MEDEHNHDDCEEHNCSGVGGVFQTIKEMDFDRGPWTSASNGDYPEVLKYLEKGGEPNVRDSAGYTALHYSSRNGHEHITKALIKFGAAVNVQTRAGKATPLHRAVQNNYVEVVSILLDSKADPCIQDADGKTPLHKAVEVNNPKICKMLINHQPKCREIADNNHKLPKHYVNGTLEGSEVYKILKWN